MPIGTMAKSCSNARGLRSARTERELGRCALRKGNTVVSKINHTPCNAHEQIAGTADKAEAPSHHDFSDRSIFRGRSSRRSHHHPRQKRVDKERKGKVAALGQQKMLVTLVEQEDLSRKWNQPTASTSPRTRATTSGGEMRRRGEQW